MVWLLQCNISSFQFLGWCARARSIKVNLFANSHSFPALRPVDLFFVPYSSFIIAFSGRFYFWNQETKKSKWSLEPEDLGFVLSPKIHNGENSNMPMMEVNNVTSSSIQQGHDLVVTDGIALGGFSTVLRAQHTKTGEFFALKVLSKARMKKARDKNALAVELKVMALTTSSPFLIQCHGAFETAKEVFMALELVEGGDLFYHLMNSMIKTNWGLPEHQVKVILAELVVAVQHLHSASYIHRDIKVFSA